MRRKDLKFDGGKLRYDLIPQIAKKWMAIGLTMGLYKYTENSWKQVPGARKRYLAALMRHVEGVQAGHILDKDGYPHIAGVLCNAAFLAHFIQKKLPESVDFAAIEKKYAKAKAKVLR